MNSPMKSPIAAVVRRMSFIPFIIFVLLLQVNRSFAEISGVLLSALHSRDARTRLSAVKKIGNIGDDEAVTLLMKIAGTEEENWRIKIKAIRLLGEIGNPRAVDVLLNIFGNAFLNEACPSMEWNTAVALGNFRNDGRVVDALVKALSYSDLIVREAAIQSLGKIGDPRAVPFLIPALNDKSFAIRYSAVTALGKIGSSEAIPFLKKVAESDKDPFIKSEALSVLKTMNKS
jgi:HEAT repeat protein